MPINVLDYVSPRGYPGLAMERYTPGDSTAVTNFMTRRTLASHGAFFRPFLWPGTHVLDCGCGPGTITIGIAQCVAPGGQVYGIDANRSQVQLASEALPNSEFQVASIYGLPFEANYFDAVFSHALFEHLSDPEQASREILRVLKPSGVVGLRSPDWSGRLAGPPSQEVDQALNYYGELQSANGGDLSIGRKLGSIVKAAGFTRIRTQASYECYSPVSLIAEYLARQIEGSASASADALRKWSHSPEAFFAQAWCEVIAVKGE